MKKIITVLILVLLLSSCSKVAYTESQDVEAEVINKIYSPPFFTAVKSGNVVVPISNPADYELCVKYKDIEVWRDSIELYCKYNVGDTIVMELISKYSEDNKMIKQELKFKE
jgi:hypothetical protein